MTRRERALAMCAAAATAWSAYWIAPDATIAVAPWLVIAAACIIRARAHMGPPDDWDRLAERDRARAKRLHPGYRGDELP